MRSVTNRLKIPKGNEIFHWDRDRIKVTIMATTTVVCCWIVTLLHIIHRMLEMNRRWNAFALNLIMIVKLCRTCFSLKPRVNSLRHTNTGTQIQAHTHNEKAEAAVQKNTYLKGRIRQWYTHHVERALFTYISMIHYMYLYIYSICVCVCVVFGKGHIFTHILLHREQNEHFWFDPKTIWIWQVAKKNWSATILPPILNWLGWS